MKYTIHITKHGFEYMTCQTDYLADAIRKLNISFPERMGFSILVKEGDEEIVIFNTIERIW
jgi:hypothetical protein